MPLDFRYHIISITSVFMALILGIVIGIAMKPGEIVSKEIENLQSEFKILNSDLERSKNLNKKNDELMTALNNNLMKNTLVNRNVIVIYGTGVADNNTIKNLENSLYNAGANLTAELFLQPRITELDNSVLKTLSPSTENNTLEDVIKNLGSVIGTPLAQYIVDELKKQKALIYNGDVTVRAGTVIYFGTITRDVNHINNITIPLLSSLNNRDLVLAAVSPTTTLIDPTRTYRRYAKITIDNIDTPAGMLALLAALQHREKAYGDYGIGNDTNYFVRDIGKTTAGR